MGVGLARSKKSASLMAVMVVFSYIAGELAMNSLIGFIEQGRIPALLPESTNTWSLIWGFAFLVVILAASILLGRILIFPQFQGDVHYGSAGLIRWGIFGFLVGILLHLWGMAEAVTPIDHIFQNIGDVVIVIFVYFAVFHIGPFLTRKFAQKKMPIKEDEI